MISPKDMSLNSIYASFGDAKAIYILGFGLNNQADQKIRTVVVK